MDRRLLDRSADEPRPLFSGALSVPRVFVIAWVMVVIVGFTNLARAPFAAGAIGWLLFEWALFVVVSLVVTAAALFVTTGFLLAIRRGRAVPMVARLLARALVMKPGASSPTGQSRTRS
jgi:hypothetical protein